ncbi:MAG: hypothetical protein FWG47_06010 [Propionibacteriaceae bacterium]|nr:hypothetical protein [Propionibacteriaceae bacterium]
MSQQTPNPYNPQVPPQPAPNYAAQPAPQPTYPAPMRPSAPPQPYAPTPQYAARPAQPYPQTGYAQPYAGSFSQPGYTSLPPGGTTKSSKNVLMIVITSIAVLAIIGCAFLWLSGNKPDEPVAIPTTMPTAAPTSTPTVDPTPIQTPDSTPTNVPEPTLTPKQPTPTAVPPVPTQPVPTSGELNLGFGITAALLPGWEIAEADENFYVLSGKNAMLFLEAFQADRGIPATLLCSAVQDEMLSDMPNVKQVHAPEVMELGVTEVTIAACASAFTQTQGGVSETRRLTTFTSVRDYDSLAVVGSVLSIESTTEQTLNEAITMFLNAVSLQAQARG